MHDERRGTVNGMSGRPTGYSLALNLYATFVACSILLLICSGGMVTSKNAGLAVPDWPNSYGYNMFAFPVSRWVGAVFLEHTHRLGASAVGIFVIVLAVWLGQTEPRRWVRKLGYAALALVIAQGLLGGLRVVYQADWVGVFHGCVAQAFFALVSVIALVTSRWWFQVGTAVPAVRGLPPARTPFEASGLQHSDYGRLSQPSLPGTHWLNGLGRKLLVVACLIYLQLALGAAMRHAHAGLSIPDFPKAYGHWWPQVHKADLPALNAQRTEVQHQPPTTLALIHLQMTHRLNAVLILGSVLAAVAGAWRRRDALSAALRWLITAGVALVAVQITLGIYTIWTNKAADIATAHVAVGATLFVWSVVSYVALRRWIGAPSVARAVDRAIPQTRTLEAVA